MGQSERRGIDDPRLANLPAAMLGLSERSGRVRHAVNEALDNLDTVAQELADYFADNRMDLTVAASSLARDLEQLKADIWEALDD